MSKDEDGRPIEPRPRTIAARFHVYWAGSDPDGDIAGFYFAVVETLPIAPPGLRLPPLPGPKPADYRFTRRTDSTFVFRVSESAQDRLHAFFIYAVDNQGKADPTPARAIFNSLDRFPPSITITEAFGTGFVYQMLGNGRVDSTLRRVRIQGQAGGSAAPEDTVPLGSRLDFRWRGEPSIAGTYVAGYRYKLDSPSFVAVDSSVRSVSFNTGVAGDVVGPGEKIFTLRAVDEADGVSVATRRFQMNYSPDTWFSGPDSSLYPRDPVTGERFVEVANWLSLPEFPGSLLSCDSITKLPSERPQRRTFFEVYRNRVYVRSENDTVHMNSWVIIHSGGSDLDSPYDVRVNRNDPAIPDTNRCLPNSSKVIRPGPPNGSPIGFHQQYTTFLTPNGPASTLSQSGVYPTFDAASVFRAPVIAGYQPFFQSGKVYAVVRANDGFDRDKRIPSARGLADRVDAGGGTEQERKLRSRVLTFHVNKAPKLLFGAGNFVPRPGHVFPSRRLSLNLLADDVDPFDPENRPQGVGGPSSRPVLRWRVSVRGRDAQGNRVTFPSRVDSVFAPQTVIDLPDFMVGTQDTVQVELCDCSSCESTPGQGRCVNYDIPIIVPEPAPGLATPAAKGGQPRPGPSNGGYRSTMP